MGISKLIAAITEYISEAAARIFSPTDDSYPVIGVQPFDGEPFNSAKGSDW